jgi:putative transposase
VLPYADILAWCLMPNHFHLMVYVRDTKKHILNNSESKGKKIRSLNDSIGILLRSYSRAINKQENRSGSLFRSGTKAVAINSLKSLMPTLAITQNTLLLSSILTEKQYPQICFNYIHLNPVRAKLVKNPLEWKYSSAQDFYGERKNKLTNIEVAQNFVEIDLALHLSEPLT